MKKIIITITLCLLFVCSKDAVYAQTASVSGDQLNNKLNKQINQLKEKIASRVSELNLVEKRGIIGEVSEVSGNKITVKDITGTTKIIDVDELTKFLSTSKAGTFGLSDIEQGTKISALGLYNKQSKRLLARFVRISIDPKIVIGTVSKIDKTNYQISITTEKNHTQIIDIQTTTKIVGYQNEDLVKTGFSTIATGETLLAIGYPDKKDTSLLVASRIINLSSFSKTTETTDNEASQSAQ